MRFGGYLLASGAALHALAPVISGQNGFETGRLITLGLALLLLAGLTRGRAWVAWPALVTAIAGAAAASAALATAPGAIAFWLGIGVLVLCLGAAFRLFGVIWVGPARELT